ncbi:hypothetical protein [Hugenholtzia roseola]|uniref:hypothetical protein n=1 Tax=Hugenholtzia roseola TaxID=1002 RepID=UPI00041B7648|nr:hypothetical protein [Hugenholtzia roseola]
MATKLNPQAVEQYAAQVANSICDNFFSQEARVLGAQLMRLTPIEQVNQFLIKLLFEKWQLENQKLKSPFFDYEKPDVKEALKALQDKLSHAISMERPTFEPLLIEALADALYLILAPYQFFEKEYDKIGNNLHLPSQLAPTFKRIKIHQQFKETYWDKILRKSINESIEKTTALKVLETLLSEFEAFDNPREILRIFNKYAPLELKNLTWVEPQKPKESSNFFESAETATSVVPELKPQQTQSYTEKEPLHSERQTSDALLKEWQTAGAPNGQAKEPFVQDWKADKGGQAEANEVEMPLKEPKTEKRIPFDFENNFAPALDDVQQTRDYLQEVEKPFKENPTVLEAYNSVSFESLRDIITLENKVAYISELFGGDAENYETAIAEIDQTRSYEDAMQVIRSRYFRPLGWEYDKEEVLQLFQAVERKFGSA